MKESDKCKSGCTYLLPAVFGAIGGVLVVAIAMLALRKMMKGGMRKMMSDVGEGGYTPAQI